MINLTEKVGWLVGNAEIMQRLRDCISREPRLKLIKLAKINMDYILGSYLMSNIEAVENRYWKMKNVSHCFFNSEYNLLFKIKFQYNIKFKRMNVMKRMVENSLMGLENGFISKAGYLLNLKVEIGESTRWKIKVN